jgi:MYXO-CTERM domain-containing protein
VESLRKPKIFREFACLQRPNGTEIEPGIGFSMLLLAIRLPAAPGRSAARSAADSPMLPPRYRRSLGPGPLAAALALGGFLAAPEARADLVAPYDTAIEVDTSYVTGANGATDIAWAPDGRAVVTCKGGNVVIRNTDGTKTVLSGTFGTVDTGSEKGLLGVVAHPTEANTFFFYVDNGPSTDDKHRVYKGVLAASANTLTIDSANPIVAAGRNTGDPGLEGPANHDGGGMFIFENHLYVGVGDTGANATPPVNKYSSCLNKGNGKILRVNLDGTIPSDNPLVGVSSVTSCTSTSGDWDTAAPDKRIFAWGFRNPWRLWVDSETGLMWIGDVGETTREEISVGGGNQHYGYPFNEGNTRWPDGDETGDGTLDGKSCNSGFAPGKACTYPVHDYPRSCVIGGLIPEGCGWTNAFGGKTFYIFGDNGQSWVHALEVKSDRSGVVSSSTTNLGTLSSGTSSIRQGPDGSVYFTYNTSGAVYRLTPTSLTGPDCSGSGGTGGMGGGVSGGPAGGRAAGGSGGRAADVGGTSSGGRPATGGTGSGGDAGAGESGAGGETETGGSMGASGRGSSSGGAQGAAGLVATAGTVGSGGSSSAGGPSSGGRGAGGGSGTSAKPGSGQPPKDDPGCGCRVAGPGGDGTLVAVVSALGLAGALSRRRRRRG